jgi:probable phosphoglycerate mutase
VTTTIVYLVRHGRTELNADGLLRGRLDPPLDDVGQTEAAALAQLFIGAPVGVVIASPLRRAIQTAAPIAAAVGTQLVLDEDVIDRDYGQWAGTLEADVIARFGSVDAAPGVEPTANFAARAERAITTIVERWAPRVCLVIAHDAVNRYTLASLVPSLGAPDAIPQRTGSWNRLERDDTGWRAPIVDARPTDGQQP